MRGGRREGAGRKRGTANAVTRELTSRIQDAPGGNVIEKLTYVIEDPTTPAQVALCGMRHIFGYLAGKQLSLRSAR